MSTLNDYIRKLRGLPPAPPVPQAPLPEPVFMPEGVDFSALWEEPDAQKSGLATILGIATVVLLVIILIVVIVK